MAATSRFYFMDFVSNKVIQRIKTGKRYTKTNILPFDMGF